MRGPDRPAKSAPLVSVTFFVLPELKRVFFRQLDTIKGKINNEFCRFVRTLIFCIFILATPFSLLFIIRVNCSNHKTTLATFKKFEEKISENAQMVQAKSF